MNRRLENSFWIGICFLLSVNVLVSLAAANPLDDCNSNDMEKRIAGCGEFLKGADLQPADRALALILRSEANTKQNRFDEAIEDLEKARNLQPNDDTYKERLVWARALRSDERIAKNELPGAIEDLSEATKLARDPEPLRARLVKLYDVLGRQLREAGDHKGAADIYSKAIEIEPKRADLLERRAEAKVSLADVDGAISDYTEAIALTPESTELHMRRGDLLLKQEKTTQAIEDFDFVLKTEPKNVGALLLRANALESAGADKRDDARKAYEAALTVDPKNEIAKRAIERLNSAATIMAKGTHTERTELARDMQKQLQRLGCYTGTIDGKWGKRSQLALELAIKNSGGSLKKDNSKQLGETTLQAIAAMSKPLCTLEGARQESPPSLSHGSAPKKEQRLYWGRTLNDQISCCLRYHFGMCKSGRWPNGKSLPPGFRSSACDSANRSACRRLVTKMRGTYCE